jgi:hypothetical protein
VAINADRTNARELTLPNPSSRYSLTANNLLDTSVMLNGSELKLTADGDLPPLDGAPEPAGKASLNPASITFFAIPATHNHACR